uniref:Uncharacterized protein n=1 Tax=Cacopsylla melanoneura TaxID=428564 RepID=A0A8D8X5X1_9HEMI
MVDCNVSLDEMNLSDTGKLLSPTIKQSKTSPSKEVNIGDKMNDIVNEPTKPINEIHTKSSKEKSSPIVTDEQQVEIREPSTVSPTSTAKTKKKTGSNAKDNEQFDSLETAQADRNLSETPKENSDREKIDDQKVEINKEESDTETTESEPTTTGKDKRKSGGGMSKELKKLMIDMVVQANKHVIANVLEGSGTEAVGESKRPKRKSMKPKNDSSEWETAVLKKSEKSPKIVKQLDSEDSIQAYGKDSIEAQIKTNAEEKDISTRKSQRKQLQKMYDPNQGIKEGLLKTTEDLICEPTTEKPLDGTDTNKRPTRKSQRRTKETDESMQGNDKHDEQRDVNSSKHVRNENVEIEKEKKDRLEDGSGDQVAREELQENLAPEAKRLLIQVSNNSENSEDSLRAVKVGSDGSTRRSLRQKTVPGVKNDTIETRTINKRNETDSIHMKEDSRDTDSVLSFETSSTEGSSGRRKSSRITTVKKENPNQPSSQDAQNVDKTITNDELKQTKHSGQADSRRSLRKIQNDSNMNEENSKTDQHIDARTELSVVFSQNMDVRDFEHNYIATVLERFNVIPNENTKSNARNSTGQNENTVGKLVEIIVSIKSALVSSDWSFLDDEKTDEPEFQGFEQRKEKKSDRQLLYPRLKQMRNAILRQSGQEISKIVSKKVETGNAVTEKTITSKKVPRKSVRAKEKVTLENVSEVNSEENRVNVSEVISEENRVENLKEHEIAKEESNVDSVKSRRKSRRLGIEKGSEHGNRDGNEHIESSESKTSEKTEEPIERLRTNLKISVDTGFKERRKSRRSSLEKRIDHNITSNKDKIKSLEKTEVKPPVKESNKEEATSQENTNERRLAENLDESEANVPKVERRQSRRLSLEKRNENAVVIENVCVVEVDKVITEIQDNAGKLPEATSLDTRENRVETLGNEDDKVLDCKSILNRRRESKTRDLEDMMELLHEETPTKTENIAAKESSLEESLTKKVVKSGIRTVIEGTQSDIDKEKVKKRKISFSLDVHDKTREDAQPVRKKRKLSHRESSRDEVKVIQTEEKENVLKKIMEEEQKELDRIQDKKKTIHEGSKSHSKHEKTKAVEKHHHSHHHGKEKVRKHDDKMTKEKSKLSGMREHRTPDKHAKHRQDKDRSKSDDKSSSGVKSVKDRSSERTPDKCATLTTHIKRESHDSSKNRDKRRGIDKTEKSDKHRDRERSSSKSGEKVAKEKNEKTPEKKDDKLEKSGDKVPEKSSEKNEDGVSREKPSPVSTSTPLSKPAPPPPANKLQPQPKPKKAAPKFFEDLENSMATYYADLAKKKKERLAKKQQMAASKPVVAKTGSSPTKPSSESKTESQSKSASSTKSSETRNTSSSSSSPPEKHSRTSEKSPLTPPLEKRLKPNPSETSLSLSPSKTSALSVDLPPKKNLLKKYTFNQDSDFESVQPTSSYPSGGTANMCTFSTIESKSSNSETSWSTGKNRISSFDDIGAKLTLSPLKNIHHTSSASSRLSFDEEKSAGSKVTQTLSRDYKPHKSADRFSFMKTQFDEEFTAAYAEAGVAMVTETVVPSNASSVTPSNTSSLVSSNASTFVTRNASSVAPSNVSPVKTAQLVSPTKNSLQSSFGSQGRLMGFPPQQTTGQPNMTLISPQKTVQINVPSISLPCEESGVSTGDQPLSRVKRPNIKALCTRSQYVRSEAHSSSGLCSIQ